MDKEVEWDFVIIIICLLGVQLEYNQGFAYLSYIEDARFYVAQNSADEGSPPGASDEIRETAFLRHWWQTRTAVPVLMP